MRNRRLRRLGLIGGVTPPTDIPMSTDPMDANTTTPKPSTVKNIVDHDTEDTDDNQHKQKQLKFDNDVVCTSSKSTLNNNEDVTIDAKISKNLTGSLTQRSRLLDEIEKQRIENTLNQNIEMNKAVNEITSATTKIGNVRMETDDIGGDKIGDGDSGIENMETDELPSTPSNNGSPAVNKQIIVETELDETAKQKETEICVSRILDAFWTDHCEGQIIVSETAASYKDVQTAEPASVNAEDLAFQIIMEIVMQYFDGKRIDFKSTSEQNVTSTPMRQKSRRTAAYKRTESNQMDTNDLNCVTPNLIPHNLPDHGATSYLIQSYIRSCNEHDRYNSTRNLKKFGTKILNVIFLLKEQIIRSTLLILNGTIMKRVSNVGTTGHRSVLLDLLYDDSVPSDFLRHLIEEAYRDTNNISKIFGTILNNLFTDMQGRVVGKKIDMAPINVLNHLLDITVNANADSVIRPFCNLLAKLYNFYPSLCTETPGREIVKVSYLGPFLSLSVFSEENPKLFEDEDDDWEVNLGIGLQTVIFFFFSSFLENILIFSITFSSNLNKCVVNCTQFFIIY